MASGYARYSGLSGGGAGVVSGDLTDTGTDGIVITGGTGAVLGTGTQIAQHVADATHNGYLSSTDWVAFNSKQVAGNYITALTGDGTASGPGSVPLTLATVNSNVGTFGAASQVAVFTVNGKGLITAAASTSIQIAESQVTNLTSDLALKAPLASPTFTGTVTTPLTTAGPVITSAGGVLSSEALLANSRGGTGLNTSASTGVPLITSGTWSVLGTTGTGSVARAASPTFSGTLTAAAITATGALAVNGARSLFTANSEPYSVAARYNSGTGAYYMGATNSASTPSMVWSNNAGTQKLELTDGGNLITASGSFAQQGYDTSTAISGTITASPSVPGLVINSAGGTTLKINLPSSPIDGQIYSISSVGAFTTVTYFSSDGTTAAIGGQALIGGVNRGQTFRYSLALTKWLST